MKFLMHYDRGKSDNLMRHEGDLVNARKLWIDGRNKNLFFLLKSRFSWMNHFINQDLVGIEIGSGISASKNFIKAKMFLTTDFIDSAWLDVKNVNALATPFLNDSQDFVVASNMIHHLAKPFDFFNEVWRILKPGGILLIQEVHTSLFMRLILRIMRHEGFDERTNVFDKSTICNDPCDLWSANCSIPKLLFNEDFAKNYCGWKVVHDRKVEFLIFLNSGGVTAKTLYFPLPMIVLKFFSYIDYLLIKVAPDIFALQRQIVVQKTIR
jgi:SAM-dependent methyltransferase